MSETQCLFGTGTYRLASERTAIDRSGNSAVPARRQIERAGGTEELSAMYDRLLSVLAGRPSAKIVATKCGEVEQAYRRLLESLA